MADKKSVNLLPSYLRSDKNAKFLSSTVDQFIKSSEVERVDSYVGTKVTPNYNPQTDNYVAEGLAVRAAYQLEPALVFRDSISNVSDVISYDDMINTVAVYGGHNANLDRLFRTDYYSYDPFINWDKLVNYDQYFWLPNGPDPIKIDNSATNIYSTLIGQQTYNLPTGNKISNGMKLTFTTTATFTATSTLTNVFPGKEYIVEGVGDYIRLIDLELLQVNGPLGTVYNETFDNTSYDSFGFDSDEKVALTPDYITINRASKDLNPWSRYNRWFHKEVIRISAEENNTIPNYNNSFRASRPIIEFKPNLQLYNFGVNGKKNIDLFDDSTVEPFAEILGQIGYYVDGVLLQHGYRVVFSAASNESIRSKILEVRFVSGIITLIMAPDSDLEDKDSVGINFGNVYSGSSIYFNLDSKSWSVSQQHTKHNQPPIFDLFDKNGVSFVNSTNENDFAGTKIFAYDEGNGPVDPVLGFSTAQNQNLIGVGSYQFKNHFSTDTFNIIENKVSRLETTAIGYIKINNFGNDQYVLSNVWRNGVAYQIPILENQVIDTSTSTILVKSLDEPVSTLISYSSIVNNNKVSSTATIISNRLYITFDSTLTQNDVVNLKLITNQSPNENGYYEPPLSLVNNPFNQPISVITFSQLTDHVFSMIDRKSDFVGDFPGVSNLRDLYDYAKLGTKLIINENPISFAQTFIGKKQHNLIDSIRFVADSYNQYKLNFLRLVSQYNYSNNPIQAVDDILNELNKNNTVRESFYRSDMLGFGSNKTVRKVKVTSSLNLEYPIGEEFDLNSLSYTSILVYKNSLQCLHGIDYEFDKLQGSVIFLIPLTVGEDIEFHIYKNTLGCFVPPTPSKMGLFPKFTPTILNDDSFQEFGQTVIRGHDGSVLKSFGDYRDSIILEFEKRIYNNIKSKYNRELFDIMSIIPGAFRSTNYTLAEFNEVLQQDFSKWVSKYNLDSVTNTTYDPQEPRSWNWINSTDFFSNKSVTGSVRSVYRYFYDTDEPHNYPWEMLGFSEKPDWWETYYGPFPWNSSNQLWIDLENGYIADDEYQGTYTDYQRPGISNVSGLMPVTTPGSLKPIDFLLNNVGPSEQKSNWKFGDWGPVETAWRNSSYYPFALSVAAAILYPATYASKMFDVSRVSINDQNQLIYSRDNLYLDPSKILIEGLSTEFTAGYLNFVVERGKTAYQDYLNQLQKDLTFMGSNLFHKLGGFTSKEKIQVKIDAVDPESTSPGLILPSEDYDLILNVSNPIVSSRISGIIIQRKNGKYIVKGYDREKPYFNVYSPVITTQTPSISIGGKSESYTVWQPFYSDENTGLSSIDIANANTYVTKFYKQGQIVFYANRYYRVKVAHNATRTFNADYFQSLTELPVKGGVRVLDPKGFNKQVKQVIYGTVFDNIQDVYNFILGYGEWLKDQGFIFDYYNADLLEVVDWHFSAKEFLYWSTQNWADGNLITLSPFAENLKYFYPDSVVDNLLSKDYEYSLQNADGQSFPKENFDIFRDETGCLIQTKNTENGIFFAILHSVQKEHAMVFNNTTIFNDTIFDLPSGYKQRRIKLTGFRTKNWNGDLTSPGFVYDTVALSDWEPFKFYLPGQVVRFNGLYYQSKETVLNDSSFDFEKWNYLNEKPVARLLPNFDYKVQQFEDFYSLDIDNFDKAQQDLAQHLIGFTPRSYLSKLIPDSIAQYKFYQGYIREKGTKKPLTNILKISKNLNGSIDIKEEWAFRVGNYGSYETFKEIEVNLKEGNFLENPLLLKFVDKRPNNVVPLVSYITATDILIKPVDYISSSTFITSSGTFDENLTKLTTAGYVRPDDVDATAYNKNSLLDIANNGLIQNGNTVWLGFLENGDWTVYRYLAQRAKIKGVYINTPGSSITFVTDIHHNLQIGDIISVARFNQQVNGVYKVIDVPEIAQFTVAADIDNIVNEPLPAYGTLYRFESARVSNFETLKDVPDLVFLSPGSKIWVDKDEDSKWAVYEKNNNFTTATVYSSINKPVGQGLGTSIFAREDSETVLVSSPSYHTTSTLNFGKIGVYRKFNNQQLVKNFDYELNGPSEKFCQSGTSTEFGYDLTFDINKDLFVTGAPLASFVRAANTSSVLVPLSSSTAYTRTFNNEGLVMIGTRNTRNTAQTVKAVIAQPFIDLDLIENSRFGHSVYVNQVEKTTSTLLLVGAPGNSANTGTGKVYAYYVSTVTNTKIKVEAFPGNFLPGIGKGVEKVTIDASPVTTSTGTVTIHFSSPETIGGTTATAIAVMFQNTLTSITITNSGSGYINPPTVVISAVGTTGTATATLSSSVLSLTRGARWGHAISGSKSGNRIAISAPKYFTQGSVGLVKVFDEHLNLLQDIQSPFGLNDEFGHSVEMSDLGTYLIIGSKKSQSTFGTNGKVAVYKNNQSGAFVLTQIIVNPLQNSDLKFGHSISMSQDETILSISSLGTNRSEVVRFFLNPQKKVSETTFDSNTTRFISSIPDAGAVYTYENFSGNFVQSLEMLPEDLEIGGKYGDSLAQTNSSIFVGAPFNNSLSTTIDRSKFYQFVKIDKSSGNWKKLRSQPDLVDTLPFKRVALFDNLKEEVVEYLDIFDPVKNRIPGIAEQEIKFKTAADPAIYSVGLTGTINDPSANWLDDHVGQLWWDLSTAKYVWYEQGNEVFRKNNWGKLFPGANIDIYEWVSSTLLPSEWAALADTNQGISRGISGQPKFPDNSVLSVKQIFNTVTGSFENVYFFWVKNKTLVPDKASRRISAYQVASIISDPIGNGIKHAAVISADSIYFANIQGNLIGNRVSANISFDEVDSPIPLHTEWVLLNENDSNSEPSSFLNKKFIDSLIGRDSLGNQVPDINLTYRNRYGLGIRPQQTLFKNRFEALRNVIEFSNSVLLENRIVGNYDFDRLNSLESIPSESDREYDEVVDDLDQLEIINTIPYKQATVGVNIENGKIISTIITDSGFGYQVPPKVIIKNSTGKNAEIKTEIDGNGSVISALVTSSGNDYIGSVECIVRPHRIVVASDSDSSGKWSIYEFDYDLRSWKKYRTQLYNTTLFWDYVDWKSEDYEQEKPIAFTIDNTFQLTSLVGVEPGDYIKIVNGGNNKTITLEKTIDNQEGNYNTDYNIVFSQAGTIQFKEVLWNIGIGDYNFDSSTLDETLYDQLPDTELYNILLALKDDLFVDNLKINWNKLFFIGVRYALGEQKLLDWAFKTSFINVKNNTAVLEQPPVYRLDNNEFYEEFLKEIKPYHTKIRNFVPGYSYIEQSPIGTSDFDLPAYYNNDTASYETIKFYGFSPDYSLPVTEYPNKWWLDNFRYSVKEVVVADGGDGYSSLPIVIADDPVPGISWSISLSVNSGDIILHVSSLGRIFYKVENTGVLGTSAPTHITGTAINGNVMLTYWAKTARFRPYIKSGKVYKVEIIDAGYGYYNSFRVQFFAGGQFVTRVAKASAILENNETRKNIVSMRFDRYSRNSEIGNIEVTEEFTCDGTNFEFVLQYWADPDKLTIFPTLDKKLVLAANYKIVDFSLTDNQFARRNSKFVFLNTVPKVGAKFRITYRKNIRLFNAIDRINEHYNPTSSMIGKDLPQLMSGLEYPNTLIKGLKFDYSTPILNTASVYANGGVWSDLTTSYAKTKLKYSATTVDNILYLESTDGIVPGQVINFISTSTRYIRTDTVVQSVNTSTGQITLTSPTYNIFKVRSTATAIGSMILYETTEDFNKDYRKGDTVVISGSIGPDASGFTGTFSIHEIATRNSFFIESTQVLSSVNPTIVGTATIRALSILDYIPAMNKEIGRYSFQIGVCPKFYLEVLTPSISEGSTATFVITGDNVEFGLGRTFEYSITGPNIASSDFVDPLTDVITSSASTFPVQFSVRTSTGTSIDSEFTETFTINISSYITTETVNTDSLISASVVLKDYVSTLSSTFTMISSSYTVNEGDAVTLSLGGENINFGSYGRYIAFAVTGTNVTLTDWVYNSWTTEPELVYNFDDYQRDISFSLDNTTEGSEVVQVNLLTWLNDGVQDITTAETTAGVYITVLDTSLAGQTNFIMTASTTTIYELGNEVAVSVSATNLTINSLAFTVTNVTGITVSGLNTNTGIFSMVDKGTYRIGTSTFTATSTAVSGNGTFRVSLINNSSTYVDITVKDQVFSEFGGTIVSETVDSATAFAKVKILTDGTFAFDTSTPYSSILTPIDQRWAIPPATGLASTYFVRTILDPDIWLGNATFSGPGYPVSLTSITSPQVSQWTTITNAAAITDGWYVYGTHDGTTAAEARFDLIVQISNTTSDAGIIGSGIYNIAIKSNQESIPPPSTGGGPGANIGFVNDARELF